MATIRHDIRIARTADDVWAAVSDPTGLSDWFPGLGEVTLDGDVRTIAMGGMEIAETIVTNDDDLRRFQYKITGGPMVPEFHLATIDVFDDGDGSFVVYSCEVQPDEGAALLGPVLGDALAGLKGHLEG